MVNKQSFISTTIIILLYVSLFSCGSRSYNATSQKHSLKNQDRIELRYYPEPPMDNICVGYQVSSSEFFPDSKKAITLNNADSSAIQRWLNDLDTLSLADSFNNAYFVLAFFKGRSCRLIEIDISEDAPIRSTYIQDTAIFYQYDTIWVGKTPFLKERNLFNKTTKIIKNNKGILGIIVKQIVATDTDWAKVNESLINSILQPLR